MSAVARARIVTTGHSYRAWARHAATMIVSPIAPLAYVVFTAWTLQRTNVHLIGPVTTLKLGIAAAFVVAVVQRRLVRLPGIVLRTRAALLLGVLVTLLSFVLASALIHGAVTKSTVASDLAMLAVLLLVVRTESELWTLVLAAVAGALYLATSSFVQGIEQRGVSVSVGLTAFMSNHISPALNMWLGLPLLWVFLRRRDGSVRRLVLVGMIALATGVVLGFARGVLIAAAVAGSWGFSRACRGRVGVRARVIAAAIGGGAVAIFAAFAIQRVLTGGAVALNSLMEGRLVLIDAAWNMFLQRPLLGFGEGMFRAHWGSYVTHFQIGPATASLDMPTHSAYLQIAADLGAVGLILYLVVITLLFLVLARQRQEFVARGEIQRARLALALQVCALTVVLDGLLDNAGLLERSFLLLIAFALLLDRIRLGFSDPTADTTRGHVHSVEHQGGSSGLDGHTDWSGSAVA